MAEIATQVPLGRAVISFKTKDVKQAIFTRRLDGESYESFFRRVGKTVDELLAFETDNIKYVRFSADNGR